MKTRAVEKKIDAQILQNFCRQNSKAAPKTLCERALMSRLRNYSGQSDWFRTLSNPVGSNSDPYCYKSIPQLIVLENYKFSR